MIEFQHKIASRVTPFSEMRLGDIGLIVDCIGSPHPGGSCRELVFCTSERIVSLSVPRHWWARTATLWVELIPPGDQVVLTIERDPEERLDKFCGILHESKPASPRV
jgi:hypothetical protein